MDRESDSSLAALNELKDSTCRESSSLVADGLSAPTVSAVRLVVILSAHPHRMSEQKNNVHVNSLSMGGPGDGGADAAAACR